MGEQPISGCDPCYVHVDHDRIVFSVLTDRLRAVNLKESKHFSPPQQLFYLLHNAPRQWRNQAEFTDSLKWGRGETPVVYFQGLIFGKA
jgi:hypothetical protein